MTSTLIDSVSPSKTNTKITTFGDVKFRIKAEPRLEAHAYHRNQRFFVRPGIQLVVPRSLYNHRNGEVTTTKGFKFQLQRHDENLSEKTAAELVDQFPCIERVL